MPKASRPSQPPREASFADHTVIFPTNRLKAAIARIGDSAEISMEPVARAETAMMEIRKEFRGWMNEECEALEAARLSLHAGGATRASVERLLNAATDIVGHADVFGYPLAGQIAGSLCKLILHEAERGRIPLKLIDEHVEALCATVREDVRDAASPAGAGIIRRLVTLTSAYLEQNGRDPSLPVVESPKL